jgi:uncharacterized RmlC-like cupin family protein
MTTLLAFFLALAQTGPHPDPKVDTTRPATDVLASTIAAAIKAAPRDAVVDQGIRVVDVGGYNVGVFLLTRPKSAVQGAILHDNRISEVYYMLEGAGTLVTGGTLVSPQRVPKENPIVTHIAGPSITGASIEGGVRRRIAKGDVVVIPGGTPHFWSELESDVAYLVVRSDPEAYLPER